MRRCCVRHPPTDKLNFVIMLTFRYAKQTRSSLCPLPIPYFFYSTAASSPHPPSLLSSYPFLPSSASSSSSSSASILGWGSETLKDVVLPFKEWFMSRKNPSLDGIFEILCTQDGPALDAALCRVNLRLTEAVILEILNYGSSNKDVLSCLKFFDWAGRQVGFSHTRATFHAIFKILSKAKLMPLMVEFLEKYKKQRYVHHVQFYDTLVIGYSVAGKPEIALQVFGKMRFQGIDLDPYAYHVLLNSLVEEGNFDVVDVVADQIRLHGVESEVTHSIMLKCFCRQKNLDRAEEYLRGLMVGAENGKVGLSGVLVGTFVDALCRDKQFERAFMLVEEVRKLGTVSMEHAYGAWIRDLIRTGELDGALDFLKNKKDADGYVPDVFRYNSLVCRLLRENRLEEVFDLLTEMIELGILPDEVSMNATLCFFCKAGMLDAAMELYNSRAEFGLSVNSMAYNYLINTLFGDMSVDGAYQVLKDAIEQGYFPGKKTFSIIVDALCREQKLDKMMELVLAALDRNLMPDSIYEKFISALCRSKKVGADYLVLGQLMRLNNVTQKSTYFNLIRCFYRAGRGDIAASLLMEMQEKGHKPTRQLFRAVLCCLCEMDDADEQIFRLLQLQLSRNKVTSEIYNFFIYGAGQGGKPQLARQIYGMMERSGIAPNSLSDRLMLRSYMKSNKIADSLCFFHGLPKRRQIGRKIWHIMIVGLCKACKPDYALEIFWDMRGKQLKPSMECYEELVKVLCTHRQYHVALEIVDDLKQIGRPISSFIGNVLLLHCLHSRELLNAWNNSRNLTPHSLMLGKLIDTFSCSIQREEDVENMEELIRQCFPLDLYTHNMLLRKLSKSEINYACEYLKQLHKKGYEPNRWSYDIVIHGLLRSGQTAEARGLLEEMVSKGFDLTEGTIKIM